jgi:DNA repair and recombination protein RAD54B
MSLTFVQQRANIAIKYAKKKKAELASLGQWRHINCLRPAASDNVKDHILRKLLHVPVVSANQNKKAGQLSLLDAVDIENVLAMEDEQSDVSMRDIPGGTISFLFEKGADAVLDGEEDIQEPEANAGGEASGSGDEMLV